MTARFRSWWQQIKQHPVASVLIALFVVLILLVIFGGYKFNWDWTGFNRPSKTLWDWLQLLGVLAVPVVVGFGAVWFTTRQGKVADAENKDNQRETALQAYIDKMSELLLEKHLRESSPEDEARTIARVRTITILVQLDTRRIVYVFTFLREAGLMSNKPNSSIVSLSGADLRNINLSQANLSFADLSGANLVGANLSGAFLSGANLSGANLMGANLSGAGLVDANLSGANLRHADLSGAFLGSAYLSGANLSGANLSNAFLHTANFSGANLMGANLSGAGLNFANLSRAQLGGPFIDSGAKVTGEQLKEAATLQGATMPDGSIHP